MLRLGLFEGSRDPGAVEPLGPCGRMRVELAAAPLGQHPGVLLGPRERLERLALGPDPRRVMS